MAEKNHEVREFKTIEERNAFHKQWMNDHGPVKTRASVPGEYQGKGGHHMSVNYLTAHITSPATKRGTSDGYMKKSATMPRTKQPAIPKPSLPNDDAAIQ